MHQRRPAAAGMVSLLTRKLYAQHCARSRSRKDILLEGYKFSAIVGAAQHLELSGAALTLRIAELQNCRIAELPI
jgi:hypothetical protein